MLVRCPEFFFLFSLQIFLGFISITFGFSYDSNPEFFIMNCTEEIRRMPVTQTVLLPFSSAIFLMTNFAFRSKAVFGE